MLVSALLKIPYYLTILMDLNVSFGQWYGYPEIFTPTVIKCGWKNEQNLCLHALKVDFSAFIYGCFWVDLHI